MVNFKEIYQGSRGGPTFSRGGPTFSRGSNCLFPIETHITCNFPGGGGGGGGPGPPVPSMSTHISVWGYTYPLMFPFGGTCSYVRVHIF